MSVERSQPEPLDYAARTTGRRFTRSQIVTLLGAAIALIGILVFLVAHELADYDSLAAEHARLHELLWAAFGIAVFLAGTLFAAVGLASWCRREAG